MITNTTPVGQLKPGQYFKHNRRWNLATSLAGQKRPDVWTVGVTDSARGVSCSGYLIYAATVEVAVPGEVPPPFRPATLRRRAKQAEALAAQLRDDAEALRLLADRQEASDTRQLGTMSTTFVMPR